MNIFKRLFFFILLFSIFSSSILAQEIRLVKDINPWQESQLFSELIDVNGTLFFFKRINATTTGLWKSDGTEAGTILIKELSNFPTDVTFINFNGQLLFYKNGNYPYKSEIWKSDGTNEGTVKIKEVSMYGQFTICNNKVFFCGNESLGFNSGYGYELWRTDGTETGTVMIKDIYSGYNDGATTDMVNINNILYFKADNGINGLELWKTDGTEVGTIMIKDIILGITGGLGSVNSLFNYNGTLIFVANDGTNGWEIWKSNGTEAGTSLIKDINPIGSSFVSSYGLNYSISSNGLIFTPYLNNKQEIWKTDGTPDGTIKLLNTLPYFQNFISVNGNVFFSTDYYSALWKTNGTIEGTTSVSSAGRVDYGINFNSKLFFTTSQYIVNGRELWQSDGTNIGTKIVKDIASGQESINYRSSTPQSFTISNGNLFFLADDNIRGKELWKTDGTEEGTLLVKDLDILPSMGSYPKEIIGIGNKVFFKATTGKDYHTDQYSKEIWVTDGTANNTKRFYNNTSSFSYELVKFKNRLYFKDNSTLLRTTPSLDSISICPFDFEPYYNKSYIEIDSILYFGGRSSSQNSIYGLCKTDGTITTMIKNFSILNGYGPVNLTKVGNILFFTVSTSNWGNELWRSDGTEAGTYLVKDITAGNQGTQFNGLNSINNILIFSISKPNKNELWRSDGTENGTFKLQDYKTIYNIQHEGKLNNTLIFSVLTLQDEVQLWKTDGTSNNTTLIRSMANIPEKFKLFMNQIVFIANYELWKTDGTSNGTIKLNSLYITTDLFVLNKYTLIYGASNYYNGVELWKTDGKTFTTAILKDILPGFGSSNPSNFAKVGNKLYFSVYGPGFDGIELWVMDLPDCVDDIDITSDIDSGSVKYKATFNINANNVINSQVTEAIYEAGKSISLNPGFQVKENAVFKAQIVGCGNN